MLSPVTSNSPFRTVNCRPGPSTPLSARGVTSMLAKLKVRPSPLKACVSCHWSNTILPAVMLPPAKRLLNSAACVPPADTASARASRVFFMIVSSLKAQCAPGGPGGAGLLDGAVGPGAQGDADLDVPSRNHAVAVSVAWISGLGGLAPGFTDHREIELVDVPVVIDIAYRLLGADPFLLCILGAHLLPRCVGEARADRVDAHDAVAGVSEAHLTVGIGRAVGVRRAGP